MTPRPDRSAPDAENLRQRLKKVRKRLQNNQARLERAQRQLEGLRELSYDVFPNVEVPDRVRTVLDATDDRALQSLVTCLLEADTSGRPGLVVDVGTAVAESAAALAAAKDATRSLRVHELVAGDLHGLTVDEPVALAHLDVDSREATQACLEKIAPHLTPGGRIVIDHYWASSGCRDAVDEYFTGRPGFRVETRARVHVVRT